MAPLPDLRVDLQLFLLVLLSACVLYSINTDVQSVCNGVYTEFNVTKNATESTCRSSRQCPSLQYLLMDLPPKNCSRVSVYDSQQMNAMVTVRNTHDLIILAAVGDLNVTCTTKPQGGLSFVNCTDVQLFAFEWINCELNSTKPFKFFYLGKARYK